MVEFGCAEPEVLLACTLLCLTPPVGRGLRAPRFGRLGDRALPTARVTAPRCSSLSHRAAFF